MNKQPNSDSPTGLGGVLGALEKLAKLADDFQNAQSDISREGELDLGKNSKATYRFRVRTLGDVTRQSSKSDFKPFEKSAPPKATKPASSNLPKRTLAEPETDVFIEGDVVVIYAQLPGVSKSDIFIDAHDDRLMLRAENASFLYQKELLLPARVQAETLFKSYHNGILEVRLTIQSNA